MTMAILGLLYIILVWWLYEFTRGKFFHFLKAEESEEEVETDESTELS